MDFGSSDVRTRVKVKRRLKTVLIKVAEMLIPARGHLALRFYYRRLFRQLDSEMFVVENCLAEEVS